MLLAPQLATLQREAELVLPTRTGRYPVGDEG
jgi:hypothetical protein